MSTIQKMRVLSDPAVFVGGQKIPIIPNSVKISIEGEASVRAVSTGGGGTTPVVGTNAEANKGHCEFSVPMTADMVKKVREWSSFRDGTTFNPLPIHIVDEADQYVYEHMFMIENTEASFEHEGAMDTVWEGSRVQ